MGIKIRIDDFHKLKQKYEEFYLSFYAKGQPTLLETEKGTWGPSFTQDIYEFFTKINLKKYKNFIDLGSGDGKIPLIASLFEINATGIEFDKDLIKISKEFKHELKLNAKFIQGDFLEHNLSKYDFIFINPDKGFEHKIEDKLLKEMNPKAKLVVYNNIFLPRFLKKGKTFRFDGIPIIEYKKR